MYDSKFKASREILSTYSAANPADPLAYSLVAASYLFSELQRGGALTNNLLSDDKRGDEAGSNRAEPTVTTALNEAASQARLHAEAVLV